MLLYLVVLRAVIIVFSLIIWPTQLYHILMRTCNSKDRGLLVYRTEDRTLFYMIVLSSGLWCTYAILIGEWLICFTSVFNVSILLSVHHLRLANHRKSAECDDVDTAMALHASGVQSVFGLACAEAVHRRPSQGAVEVFNMGL
jgi:hypothetical protein